jgi:LysR family tcuABC transcriptional regulator
MIEMDAMIGTLEFVAQSDWVTILPALICVHDLGKSALVVNPIINPPLYAEFVVIEPARRTLSVQAQLFLECLEAEVERIQEVWSRAGLKLETA